MSEANQGLPYAPSISLQIFRIHSLAPTFLKSSAGFGAQADMKWFGDHNLYAGLGSVSATACRLPGKDKVKGLDQREAGYADHRLSLRIDASSLMPSQAKTTTNTPAVMTVRPIRKMMLLLKICAIETSWEQTWKSGYATQKPTIFDEPILCLHRHTPNQMEAN